MLQIRLTDAILQNVSKQYALPATWRIKYIVITIQLNISIKLFPPPRLQVDLDNLNQSLNSAIGLDHQRSISAHNY